MIQNLIMIIQHQFESICDLFYASVSFCSIDTQSIYPSIVEINFMNKSIPKIYSSPLKSSRPVKAYKFGTSPRFRQSKQTTWEISDSRLSECTSRSHSRTKTTLPQETRFWRDRKALREKSLSPSPHNYTIQPKSNQKNLKGPKFDKSRRIIIPVSNQKKPGPGSYSISPNKGTTNIKFTKQKRVLPWFEVPCNKIGPSEYYSPIKSSKKANTLGNSLRFPNSSSKSPGALYIQSEKPVHSYSFCKAERVSPFKGTSCSPGPGAYQQVSDFYHRTSKIMEMVKRI